MDSKEFRGALGAFATGVTIVTTHAASGVDFGMTVTSFNSVSLEPPLVLWSIDRRAEGFVAFTESRHFAVHVLAHDQQALANRFAQRGIERFADLPLARGAGNVPILQYCATWFVCEMEATYQGGDHVILVGRVVAYRNFGRPPLLFHASRYAELRPTTRPPLTHPPRAAADLLEALRSNELQVEGLLDVGERDTLKRLLQRLVAPQWGSQQQQSDPAAPEAR